jgi:carbamoylphosphate synthase large subunit
MDNYRQKSGNCGKAPQDGTYPLPVKTFCGLAGTMVFQCHDREQFEIMVLCRLQKTSEPLQEW